MTPVLFLHFRAPLDEDFALINPNKSLSCRTEDTSGGGEGPRPIRIVGMSMTDSHGDNSTSRPLVTVVAMITSLGRMLLTSYNDDPLLSPPSPGPLLYLRRATSASIQLRARTTSSADPGS